MARRFKRSSHRRSSRSRRLSPVRVVFIALCVVGLYLLVRTLWGGSGQSPAVDSETPPVAGILGPAQDEPVSPERQRFDDLVNQLAADSAKLPDVRDKLNAMLGEDLDAALAEQVRGTLTRLAQQWLFGPECIPGDRLCAAYRVQRGDLLSTIGQEHRVPWELLAQINRINPKSLRLGQTLKVVHGPFHARVSLSHFRMDVYLQDTYVRSFSVGVARPGKRTPTGTWLVKDRIRDAAWTDPETGQTLEPGDPDYPLGPVWMPLEGISGQALGQPSYGIHGTNEPESIGTASSMGCVRLRNADAETVFNLLMPGHSRVIVAQDP